MIPQYICGDASDLSQCFSRKEVRIDSAGNVLLQRNSASVLILYTEHARTVTGITASWRGNSSRFGLGALTRPPTPSWRGIWV